jgi:signal transduction histidine kinase
VIVNSIRSEYERAFDAYLSRSGEATRLEAYALGRRALAGGAGLLDLVSAMHGSLVEAMRRAGDNDRAVRIAEEAEGFFLECVSAFEMAFLGAREANNALRHHNEMLEQQAKRIAREVHDSAGQLMASAHIELDQAAATAPAELAPRFRRIKTLLDRVESDVRRLSHELRPTILDDLGIVPALRFLGEGVSSRTGLAVSVAGSSGGRLPPPVETVLYRVAQEALTNVGKHARASRVEVRVERSDREVLCEVCDDGVGFDSAKVLAGRGVRGLGLIGMRERLAPLGGTIRYETTGHDRGTRLVVTIPLEASYAHKNSAG